MPDPTLDLRNDPARLERTLMSLHLHDVLAQLPGSADRPGLTGERQAEPAANVRSVLGEWLPHVLERGLTTLPAAVLERLLTEPALLLELQELLLCEGGNYWQEVSRRLPEVATLEPRRGPGPLEEPASLASPRPEKRSPGRKPIPSPPARWPVVVATAFAAVAAAACIVILILYRQAESRVAALRHQNQQMHRQFNDAHRNVIATLLNQVADAREREMHAATDRLTRLCQGLSALSALPPPEAVAALPPDEAPPQNVLPLPASAEDETLALPAVERQLEPEGPRQRALAILLDGLRNDKDARTELVEHPDKLLRHDDPAVRHGTALALEELGREQPLTEF